MPLQCAEEAPQGLTGPARTTTPRAGSGDHFLQPDPSQQEGTRSYVYAKDDPVDYADPSGLAAIGNEEGGGDQPRQYGGLGHGTMGRGEQPAQPTLAAGTDGAFGAEPGFNRGAAIASAQAALPLAQHELVDLQAINLGKYGSKNIAGTEGSRYTLSGYGSDPIRDVRAYSQYTPDVITEAADIPFSFPKVPGWDQRSYPSHAELQMTISSANEPMAVTDVPCGSCRAQLRRIAALRGFTQVVADPKGVSSFYPSGFVERVYNLDASTDVFTPQQQLSFRRMGS